MSASDDDFARLASVLAPRAPTSQPGKKKKARKEPDRSRDHAMYLAPHRPPAKSIPPIDDATTPAISKAAVYAVANHPTSTPSPQRGVIRANALSAALALVVALVGAGAFLAIASRF